MDHLHTYSHRTIIIRFNGRHKTPSSIHFLTSTHTIIPGPQFNIVEYRFL